MNRFSDISAFNRLEEPVLEYVVCSPGVDIHDCFVIEWGFLSRVNQEEWVSEVSDIEDFFEFVEHFNASGDMLRFSGNRANFWSCWEVFVHLYTMQFNRLF